MTDTTTDTTTDPATATTDLADSAQDLAVTELLVEEISIDGMCGVY